MAIKRMPQRQFKQWYADITNNLQKNNLWRRMLKNTTCTTINLIIGLIPAVIAIYGRATYLGAMASVFGHPGQRFGQMAETLSLITIGTFAGMAWALLGLWLSSLVYHTNVEAAWAIRAVFFTLALLFHGLLRASTPRLFMFVFWFLLINLTILTNTATAVSTSLVTQISYPILTAVGVIILVNISIFPEFSSGFLARSTIETLSETVNSFQQAGNWFMADSKELQKENSGVTPTAELRAKLATLTDKKSKLRAQLGSSKKAQAECSFELVFAVLPPRSLKPISMSLMTRLVQVTVCLINACESKYALIGYDHETNTKSVEKEGGESESESESSSSSLSDSESSSSSQSSSSSSDEDEKKPKKPKRKSRHLRNLDRVKPIREIESGDIDLLEHILAQIRGPAKVLQDEVEAAANVVTSALAFCYDLPKLPSGTLTPDGIVLEEIDIHLDTFTRALSRFDQDSAAALENAAAMAYGQDSPGDIMPRMETHLVSSYLISLRQAAAQLMEMLRYSRSLVERRQDRRSRRKLYFPKISWKKWLTTGGERDVNALPENARKEARAGRGLRQDSLNQNDEDTHASNEQLLRQPTIDEEAMIAVISKQTTAGERGKIPRRKGPQKSEVSNIVWLRGLAADAVELIADSEALAFALKMCAAAFIVTWPAFVPHLNSWYNSVRGSWATLQLVLLFEVSVGTSFQGFVLRVVGTTFGCTVGFLGYLIGQGHSVVMVVILVIGIIPSTYVQLGTPYVKTGIISIVSMSVVGLATIVARANDQPWEIYVKRLACFLIGGIVALCVEMFLFPVRARDRLVESLASSIQQISQMEVSIAVGIDQPRNIDIKSLAINASFIDAKEKAEQALNAAKTFLPFCLIEPRLKGSFKGQAMIYGEIVFVLFQIVDRMDNMLHIRKTYGSSVLEELNEEVLPYRRNVAAAITLTLFAVHEALTTRLPLPQFLPSSRVAQLRYVSRVRELLLERAAQSARQSGAQTPATINSMSHHGGSNSSNPLQFYVLKSVTKQSFLSWNAVSAGMMEIIEYLEELVDLAKLLVGVNAFRSGMLERPKFHEYVSRIKARDKEVKEAAEDEEKKELQRQQQQEEDRQEKGFGKKISRSRTSSFAGRRMRGFSFGARKQSSGAKDQPTAVPGSGLRRRQTAAASTGDGAADKDEDKDEFAVEDDLPMSLQRVMTKRMEGREGIRGSGGQRRSRRHTDDPKGKRPLRGAMTWGA
ncbi:hypothetical protein F4778DRAFT_333778 [Xylariomycetidae sp. FL2044]|nr:hypothetical protein F4778DRAFT_333778 [Xylariomycetidae sp. FL2044]